jgi:uncharacterized protein (DUF305 family)
MEGGALKSLPKAFFIYDRVQEETADEDIILYFHPDTVPEPMQIAFQGACGALRDFTENFTTSPLRVIEMTHSKFTYKQTGHYTMVLSSSMEDSSTSLVHQMDLLWDAFQFYNGGFDHILKDVRDRREAQTVIKDACKYLVHAVEKYWNTSLHFFNPLPYKEIPQFFSRHFVFANEILTSINGDAKNLGACLLYQNRVICTHLDTSVTRWVVNLIDALDFYVSKKKKNKPKEYKQAPEGSDDKDDEETRIFEHMTVVSIPKTTYDKLLETKKKYVQTLPQPNSPLLKPIDKNTRNNSNNNNSNAYSSMNMNDIASALESEVKDMENEKHQEKNDRVFVGLLIVTMYHISVGVLMESSALDEQTHINKIRHLSNSKLYEMEKILQQMKQTLKSWGQEQAEPEDEINNNLKTKEGAIDVRPTNPSTNVNILASANNDKQASYNFVTFNELTQMQKSFIGGKKADSESKFSAASGTIHDLFTTSPDITKVVVKDHASHLYSRKIFGRETHFQHPVNAQLKAENLEDTVKNSLKNDHNITLL